jgi:hypothetical protein
LECNKKRTVRFKEGKKAVILNLFMVDTQEEKWLRIKQVGQTGIVKVTNIKDVSEDFKITSIVNVQRNRKSRYDII